MTVLQVPFLFNTCVCVGVWKPEDSFECYDQEHCPPPVRQAPIGLELTSEARLAAQQVQGSPVSTYQVLVLQAHTTHHHA